MKESLLDTENFDQNAYATPLEKIQDGDHQPLKCVNISLFQSLGAFRRTNLKENRPCIKNSSNFRKLFPVSYCFVPKIMV